MSGKAFESRQCGEHMIGYRRHSDNHYFGTMTNKRWSKDIAYAMTPFKLLTWPLGVWPLQVFNVFSLIRWIVATCCVSVLVIVPALEIQFGCTDAGQNVDSLMCISCGLLTVLKIILFRVYKENLTDNHNSAINDYLTIEDKGKRAVMRRHAFFGRMLAYFMVCFSYCSSALYTYVSAISDETELLNVTNDEGEFPIPSRCTVEYLNIPASMISVIFFIEFMALLITSTGNHGTDAMFLNSVLHICGQVKILKADFTNFDTMAPKVNERFNALIERHNYLIVMANKLAKTISFVMVMQLFVSGVLLCVIGFQLILALKISNFGMFAKGAVVINTFMVQLSSYSIVGDYLKSQMEEVGLSIYKSTWYNLPLTVSKNISFIIMSDQYPVKLQAGNFVVVNLSTFMNVIKTSMSYLSVLRVMVDT